MSMLSAIAGKFFSAGDIPQDYPSRRQRMKARTAEILNAARAQHQLLRGVLPHIDRLGAFKHLFVNAEGLAFHDGRKETLINAVWSSPDLAQERGYMLGTWAQRGGVIALVDTTGRLYLAPSRYKGVDGDYHELGPALEQQGFYKADWPAPVGAGDMPVGRVNYGLLTRVKPNHGLHAHIQAMLGRRAFERPGQLERFVEGVENAPGVKRQPVTLNM